MSSRPTVVALIATAGIWSWVEPAHAQQPPEPFLLMEVSRECASEEEDEELRDAIELRLPDAFVVRGAVEGAEPDWRVTWRPRDDEVCELLFSSSGSSSSMALGPHPGADEIQLAASRVAWLASVSPSRSRPLTVPEKSFVPVPEPGASEPEPPDDEPEESPEVAPEVAPEPEEPSEVDPEDEAPEVEAPEVEPEAEPSAEPGEPEPPRSNPIDSKIEVLPGLRITPHPLPERAVAKFSLNLIGGSTYGLDGFELGGLWNHESAFAVGVQMALGANLVDGHADVVQIALGGNSVGGSHEGISMALGANLLNASNGVSLAGGFNGARGELKGIQIAGGINGVRRELRGVQIAAVNYAGSARGLQLGLLNVAGRVDGAQLGLLNVSETSDFSFGLLSLMYGEPFYVTVRGSQTGFTFGFEHGWRYFRWSYLGGFDPFPTAASWRFGLGPGLRFGGERVYVDVDALFYAVVRSGDPLSQTSQLLEGRLSLGWRLLPRLALYAGVSGKALVTGLIEGADLAPEYARGGSDPESGVTALAWPELHIGIRL